MVLNFSSYLVPNTISVLVLDLLHAHETSSGIFVHENNIAVTQDRFVFIGHKWHSLDTMLPFVYQRGS